jgi:hypothetical protein
MSLPDKLTEALEAEAASTIFFKGFDAASGSMSVLFPLGTNTVSMISILAFCWDEIVGGIVLVDWFREMLQPLEAKCVWRAFCQD